MNSSNTNNSGQQSSNLGGFSLTGLGSRTNLITSARNIFTSKKLSTGISKTKGNENNRAAQVSPNATDFQGNDQNMIITQGQNSPTGVAGNYSTQNNFNRFQSNIPGKTTNIQVQSQNSYYPSGQSNSPKILTDTVKQYKTQNDQDFPVNEQKKVYNISLNATGNKSPPNQSFQQNKQVTVTRNLDQQKMQAYNTQINKFGISNTISQGVKISSKLNDGKMQSSQSPPNSNNNYNTSSGISSQMPTQITGKKFISATQQNSPGTSVKVQNNQIIKGSSPKIQGTNQQNYGQNQEQNYSINKKTLFQNTTSKFQESQVSQGHQSDQLRVSQNNKFGQTTKLSGLRSALGNGTQQMQQTQIIQQNNTAQSSNTGSSFKKARNSAQPQIFTNLKSQISNYATEAGIDDSQDPSRILNNNKVIITKTIETNSPKNNFLGIGNQGKINQKIGPAQTSKKMSAGTILPQRQGHLQIQSNNYQKYQNQITSQNQSPSAGLKFPQNNTTTQIDKSQRSPQSGRAHQEPQDDIDVGNDDYDEETDEFAGYSGTYQYQNQQQYASKTYQKQIDDQLQNDIQQNQKNQISQKNQYDQNLQGGIMSLSIKSSSSKNSKKSVEQRERDKNIKEIKMYYWTKVDQGDRNEVVKILSFARQNFNKENELYEIVNCTNSDGFTPLHLASSEGHAPLIEILIKFGAQVDARTNNFRTPLHIACLRGNLSVIQALVQHGADINAKDIDSNTPCHFCSEYGHRYCLKFLLTRNPYLFANNNEEKSAIDVAISSEILNEFQEFITKSKDLNQSRKQQIQHAQKPSIQMNSGMGQSSKISGQTGSNHLKKDEKLKSSQGETNIGGNSAGNSNIESGGGSGSGVNSSSDGRNTTSGNQTNNSRLSANTRIINKVSAVQQKMNLKNAEEAGKVTQIKIHGGIVDPLSKKGYQTAQSTTQESSKLAGGIQKTQKTGPEEFANLNDQVIQKNAAYNTNFEGDQKKKMNRDASPGIPAVQDVDGVEDQLLRSSYGQEHFLPLKKLGSGSFGDVYLVRDKNSGKLYAMKTLSKRKILGQNLVRYAKTERDVLSYMRHPFIVNLNYAFQTQTKLFLILDFCPGGDLGKIIAHERRFTEDRARLYIAEVLLALQELHKRDIIYRDLKPDNVVLDDDGHALLTDFGLSKEGVLEVSKGAKSFCGSIAYLAPEMLRRVGHGKSVDWYLLGVLLYEMLVGTPPYFSGNKDELFNNIMNGPLKLPRSISTEAKNLMVSLLNRNPTKRLGAGPEGALEIQRHPFFESINWDDVINKRTKPPRPKLRSENFNSQYPYSEFSKKQINDIFDDEKEIKESQDNNTDNVGTQNVDGWSFVKMTESHIELYENMKNGEESNALQ